MRLLTLLLVMIVCAAGPAVAGLFEDGQAASNRGDYATALRLWRPIADEGHAQARVRLGLMYEFGSGVPQDYATAVAWYRKAADQGDADGQKRLASMYFWGHGVPHDPTSEAFWYRKGVVGEQRLALVHYERAWMEAPPTDSAAIIQIFRKVRFPGIRAFFAISHPPLPHCVPFRLGDLKANAFKIFFCGLGGELPHADELGASHFFLPKASWLFLGDKEFPRVAVQPLDHVLSGPAAARSGAVVVAAEVEFRRF